MYARIRSAGFRNVGRPYFFFNYIRLTSVRHTVHPTYKRIRYIIIRFEIIFYS